jgi:AcrR family transcriptional regulator
MTSTPVSTTLADPRPSLRERKKLATRRSLRRVALDLVVERGFAHVTVEDIAEAADVSPRTFFNYFPSKEAAMFGADLDSTRALRRRLVEEAPGESALAAVRIVLIDEMQHITEELNELGGDPAQWLSRVKQAQADPHLRAARATHMSMIECTVAEALAERLGTDVVRDPYPLLLASAAMGVMRAAFAFWGSSGGVLTLSDFVDAAFRSLAQGLPEDCDLRTMATASITTTGSGAGPSPGPRDACPLDQAQRKDHHS